MNIIKKLINNFLYSKRTKMEQEIIEQPDIIFELIRKYISKDYKINIDLPDDIENIILVASGSSYHSASITANFIKTNVNINAHAYYASEVLLDEKFNTEDKTLYIFVSQSGETFDTNNALNKIKNKTDKILGITNVKNSTLWNNSKYRILTCAGSEKSIASTKSMSSQLFCLLLTAIKLMEIKNIPSIKLIDELLNVPECIKNILHNREQIKKNAKMIAGYNNGVILASGMCYPLAQEGALKFKETSYINLSAYPMGEFLHGHIAILNRKCFVIVLINNQNISVAVDILNKISKYKAEIFIITEMPIKDSDKDDFIQTNTKSDTDFLFSSLVSLQLLSLETAVLLNSNVDNPCGLTKIVK